MDPSGFESASTPLSQFFIHDNTFLIKEACGCAQWGIHLYDAYDGEGATIHWFRATILHNMISLPTPSNLDYFKEGIDANNTTGILIAGNTISDTGSTVGAVNAISLWGNDPSSPPSTNNVVTGNDVSRFTPDPNPTYGIAQIYLDPYTSDNTVVCNRPSDTVFDQGTTNTLIGCTKLATPEVTPLVRPTPPTDSLKLKPWLPWLR